MSARILSIQIGQPQTYGRAEATDTHDKLWTTAFYKEPVAGPMSVAHAGIAGDGVADRENHGGSDKAVLAYSAEHYPFWKTEMSLAELPFGGFGENLTIEGSDEQTVCIGDTWQAREVRFEVSQPRQPCWKLARRWRTADLAKRVVANGKSGWYLRVLTEGTLEAGFEIALRSRPHPDWTIARAADVMYRHPHDRDLNAELAALPELAESWRVVLLERAERTA